jgi:two-component system, chemotaxis family, chemotaxis protein CheY
MAKILITDDSGLSRKILKKILSQDDHEIIEAENGLIALESYFIEKPNVVFLDMAMPDMSGLEVLEQIIKLDTNAQIIMATADLQDLTIKVAKETGAVGYVTKPFNKEKVLDILRQVLNNS